MKKLILLMLLLPVYCYALEYNYEYNFSQLPINTTKELASGFTGVDPLFLYWLLHHVPAPYATGILPQVTAWTVMGIEAPVAVVGIITGGCLCSYEDVF